ncbi:cupin domain-containing protein [Chloracidobacterium validum]|uniref:Cupin domain-containing protein n=2 Tax=Chloracidobacterium validum TaxID=2821543 RepID=A0ABX8BAN6_9BACT|nr:cupin domain-containing protein [Chloracidobacterium validum]
MAASPETTQRPPLAPDHRFTPTTEPFRWENIPVTAYQRTPATAADFAGITRQTLFGQSGETIGFEVRYFEIAPGGWSSLECHGHAHAVIGLRGVGKVLLGDTVQTLRFLDLAYIGPNCVHRLVNDEPTPFGFLCIVDAKRDRPRRLRPADVPDLLTNPALAALIQRGGVQGAPQPTQSGKTTSLD